MEGHSPHSGSHYYTAAPHPPSSATATSTAAAAFFNKVTANHGHLGVPPYAPRAEHFSEMFRSFRSGLACSIPVLHLPPNDYSVAAFDSGGCSGLVYSEIFGGFDFADFAVSYDELFRQSNGSQQYSDSDDAWTEVGAGSLLEESDASVCSGRNQCFLNGDFHQTTDSKLNVCYHKADKGTAEDSNPIHVAELGDVPGNSYIYDYDGSNLLKEDEERYSYGVVDDIILHVDSSGSISVETQSETASNPSIPSYGDDRKAGRSHGINLSSTGISVSDVCATGEPSYSPPSSRQPPTVVVMKKNPVSSMSDIERPKGNASKALFDIGSLDFLNLELDTGSSSIVSAAAIQEAMDWAKLKLESARESMERKKDDAKGTRPVMKNDMNWDGKMRMFFEESISRKDELQGKHGSGYNLFKKSGKGMQDISEASQVLPDTLQAEISLNGAAKLPVRKIIKSQNSSEYPKVDEESRKRETAVCQKDGNAKQLNEAGKRVVSAHNLVTKSLKLEKTNANRIEDEAEVAENEMEKPTKASKSENLQKMDKVDSHAELKSTEEDTYEERHLISESEYSTSSNNKVPEVACECEDLKSSNLAAGPDEKNIEPTAVTGEYDVTIKNATAGVGKELKGINGNLVPEDIEEDEKLRREEAFEREHLRELELERKRERESELEKERHRKLEEERDKKKEKLHIKRLAELREREREKKLEKDHLRKLVEERQREREKEMEKECLRAGQAAVEREIVEARQKAMAEARERLEKACANFREKSFSEKSTEARLRAERAAVARAHAEARERAIEKAMAERATFEAREQVERSASEQLSSAFSDIQLRHNSSSSDLWNTDKSDEVKVQPIQRSRSRLERHCRTVERVAKALAEKNMRDLNAQKEQAERNRLAESLDADIKRWSSGKEGNLRALLSTLQYILGQDSGWHPIPLTEVITSSAVKKAYRKATLCVHPDKLQQRGATIQQKYICEKVFDLLKDAWNKFSSEEK